MNLEWAFCNSVFYHIGKFQGIDPQGEEFITVENWKFYNVL